MSVFVDSSYHLNLSFPHLVVILRTLKTPKNIFCFVFFVNGNSKQEQEHYEQLTLLTIYKS